MKKKLVIEKCCNCPFYKRIAVKNEALKAVCFGRNKVYYLLNDTESSIPEDCPLETIKEMSETKIILDACCGSRMFWFDKENPLVLFADIRDEEHVLCDGRNLKVHPDIVSDFTDMPFLDESFKLVVFDPPHLLKAGKDSWLVKKYGKLPEDWPRIIKKGIDECFRVLEDYGVLIFKWNEDQITVREVLKAIGRQPLFGHTTGRHGKTMWMCFMKLPINE